MYLTGQLNDYEDRLHQLPQTTGEVESYKLEGSGYLASISPNLKDKWNREFDKRTLIISVGSERPF